MRLRYVMIYFTYKASEDRKPYVKASEDRKVKVPRHEVRKATAKKRHRCWDDDA